MNITQARTRLLFLAREIRVEAQHWKLDEERFGNLVQVAMRLAYLSRTIDKQPEKLVIAAMDMGVGVIVRLATARALGEPVSSD